jgi:hypothetical protein
MFKVVFWRHGKRIVEEYGDIAEAHRQFNFIGEYELGFSECILDQNDKIIRDGKNGVIGIRQENRVGKIYNFK